MLPRLTVLCLVVWPCMANDLPNRAVQVLQSQCGGCHGSNSAISGLRIDSRDALLKGGTRGSAIKPGSSQASLLIQAVNHSGKLAMPPGKKIEAADAELLARWVDAGAAWPEASKWWSFQPPVRPAVPSHPDSWVRTPIDAFILDKLRAAKLQPAAEADRRTIIRRVYFDLHGLPPTADAIEKFLSDTSPNAYEKLIDEL